MELEAKKQEAIDLLKQHFKFKVEDITELECDPDDMANKEIYLNITSLPHPPASAIENILKTIKGAHFHAVRFNGIVVIMVDVRTPQIA